MQIDPRHLTILAAVVESGGLTEGAARLGKSQPSLSRTVALLEARLGSPLFEKGRRPLRPTELCLALAAQGRRIAAAAAEAGRAAASYSGGRSGTVRVAGTPIFMDGVISAMIAGFQTAWPEVRIDQSYGYLPELAERLRSGAADLAICPLSAAQVPEGHGFAGLLPGRNVIACAPGHPLARKPALTLADIAPFSWIAPPETSPLCHDLRDVLAGIGITDPRIGLSGGSLASILTVIAGSEALTVLPYSVVFMLRHTRTLQALPIRIGHPERQLGLLSRNDRPEGPAVRRFRLYLERQFDGLSRTIVEQERNALWRA